ncbi:MAG: choline ABC transporter ATP-binding protein [Geminicoccaceae bacterium]
MAAVTFSAVDIVFGNRPEIALPLLDQGLSREEILAQTGQVLGVAGCSLAVERGEICVLMGLSGSGKSTLLRAVNRLNEVVRGSVTVDDQGKLVDVATCDAKTLRHLRMRRVAMVFQQFALLPWRTVAENVAFGLELRGVSRAECQRIVMEKLELVHLEKWAGKFAHELSGGMQQRVGLARAFATDADILLMDEPFSALDPLIRDKLQDDLLELQQRLGKTIIFVSHDLDEALKIGNTVAIMEGGRIIQAGPPESIVTNPATDYVRAFVANVNPLNVLKLGTLMATTSGMARDGETIVLDPRIGLTARLDGGGSLASVDGAGLNLRPLSEIEPFTDGNMPCDWLLVASPEAPMRLAIEALRNSGWPVLVIDDQRRPLGLVGIDELLEALRRKSPATA